LRRTLGGMATRLFGSAAERRFVDAYFPFTDPSVELEVRHDNAWLELLGAGVMQPRILDSAGVNSADHIAWAFGLGLERIAMALYRIPDIRLFWSEDARFRRQFTDAAYTDEIHFKPFSRQPAAPRDVTFWLPADGTFHENQLHDLVRAIAGDLAESVQRVDEYRAPASGRVSHCYRVVYRAMERTLTGDEVDTLHTRVRAALPTQLRVELR